MPGNFIALLGASATYIVVAAVWHFVMPAHRPDAASYPFTSALVPSMWWTAIVFVCVAAALGYLTNRRWPVALGLILPLLGALVIEIIHDPTGHNLFPFEIVFGWLPGFLIALAAAHVGGRLREKSLAR